ncbi:chromatin assembly factor 1 subunit A isoform X2 [Scleropages formosus]|uniref:chromatin assembly factor 1 subunit A isoform X2 n=1 Tax=Scleropages formosus TaxID=113540 RepID=UPI000878AE68|nr:chromatin assembly factor 1 subunit A isoform X2 [Scleropages formosus]XP_018583821.1 chromatin assembly factor 1 subunit A isoform X2 [Scleropages formosus]XP_018583822.1 chromatin assembly factor 1 subunit A isoform X2 [Scleropages formosus]
MIVMLSAEDPSAEGPLASTPKVRGSEYKSSTAVKKLVQARLPFKRLNPAPKDNGQTKRVRSTLEPPSLEAEASDGENDLECSPLSLPQEKALVNGRGPLDGFMSRRSCPLGKSVTIDLTEDSNSTESALLNPTVTLAAALSTQESQPRQNVEAKEASTAKGGTESLENVTPFPQPSSPQEQLPCGFETEEDQVGIESSWKRSESVTSPISISSLSAVESSPEITKGMSTSPSADLKTNANTAEKKLKRRSLKISEEERRQKQEEQLERNRQRQEAKAAKERKREEARKLKEEREREKKEKKEREEREKRERKEREEKEKAEKQRVKEEQRKVKQEAKLEEKRKKEEEKRLKEEKDRIKAEKAEITRFLQKPKTLQAPKTLAAACGKFAPFEIKENMFMAPSCRVVCEEEALEALDRYLAQPDSNLNGLRDWRSRKPRRSGPTCHWHSQPIRDCVVLVDGPKPDGVPDRQCYGRMKLLQFHENYRPAYWGTWRKKSKLISPRYPLRQDKDLLDYEVDSDEEWEEEEPGESLSHSEGDDDEEGGEEDDEDDGFFVPHGYLSDGEGALEEEESGDLEKQKVLQRLKAREWDELMSKKKFKVLESVVKGCVWRSTGCDAEALLPYAVCMLEPLPGEEPVTPEGPSKEHQDDQMVSQLLPLLHGNVNSSKVIITEFQEFCRQQSASPTNSSPNWADNVPTRIRLKRLIKENAVYEKRTTYRRCCWYVHAEVLARFGMESLPVPSQWNSITTGANNSREEGPGAQGVSPTTPQSSVTIPCSSKKKSAGSMSITKFMKKFGEAEQVDAMETDGFQADTEDDEDDADCIIIDPESGSKSEETSLSSSTVQNENPEHVEVPGTDPAALVLSCYAPTPATA